MDGLIGVVNQINSVVSFLQGSPHKSSLFDISLNQEDLHDFPQNVNCNNTFSVSVQTGYRGRICHLRIPHLDELSLTQYSSGAQGLGTQDPGYFIIAAASQSTGRPHVVTIMIRYRNIEELGSRIVYGNIIDWATVALFEATAPQFTNPNDIPQ